MIFFKGIFHSRAQFNPINIPNDNSTLFLIQTYDEKKSTQEILKNKLIENIAIS
jgi:hypothetical protein